MEGVEITTTYLVKCVLCGGACDVPTEEAAKDLEEKWEGAICPRCMAKAKSFDDVNADRAVYHRLLRDVYMTHMRGPLSLELMNDVQRQINANRDLNGVADMLRSAEAVARYAVGFNKLAPGCKCPVCVSLREIAKHTAHVKEGRIQ
ncbi:MAG: hypothetical protein Q8J63_00725 [Candidatus Aquicultor sp.]|nr:hypothetical protein [Candidatus Aquicultor sp.]